MLVVFVFLRVLTTVYAVFFDLALSFSRFGCLLLCVDVTSSSHASSSHMSRTAQRLAGPGPSHCNYSSEGRRAPQRRSTASAARTASRSSTGWQSSSSLWIRRCVPRADVMQQSTDGLFSSSHTKRNRQCSCVAFLRLSQLCLLERN